MEAKILDILTLKSYQRHHFVEKVDVGVLAIVWQNKNKLHNIIISSFPLSFIRIPPRQNQNIPLSTENKEANRKSKKTIICLGRHE
jgi:hypothetical protein